jgi:Double zinc ribbon
MKICPFCDGEIRDDTIKCWHCTMDLPPVKVAKQDISEQKVPPLEVSKITKEPPPRPSPQKSTAIKICPLCNSEIQDNAIFCPHCSRSLSPVKVANQHTSEQKVPPLEVSKITEEPSPRPSLQQSAVNTARIEETKVKAETFSRPSPQQRLVGKPQIKEDKGGVKTWLIWVWIGVSALILLLFASVFIVSIISQKANFGYLFVYAAMIIGDIAIIVILYSRINIEWEIKLQEIWSDYKGYIIISPHKRRKNINIFVYK